MVFVRRAPEPADMRFNPESFDLNWVFWIWRGADVLVSIFVILLAMLAAEWHERRCGTRPKLNKYFWAKIIFAYHLAFVAVWVVQTIALKQWMSGARGSLSLGPLGRVFFDNSSGLIVLLLSTVACAGWLFWLRKRNVLARCVPVKPLPPPHQSPPPSHP